MTPLGRQGPLSAADAQALLAQARKVLTELGQVSEEALAQARQAISGGRTLGKHEVKALNRAASLARYIADCAHRASWEPPKRRQAGWGFNEPTSAAPMWTPPAPETHEQRAAAILRYLPTGSTTLNVLDNENPEWTAIAVAWLRADEALRASGGVRPASKGAKPKVDLLRQTTDGVPDSLRELMDIHGTPKEQRRARGKTAGAKRE